MSAGKSVVTGTVFLLATACASRDTGERAGPAADGAVSDAGDASRDGHASPDSGDARADAPLEAALDRAVDGGPLCARVGDTCVASTSDVACCPQYGNAYDFARQCFEPTKALAFCYEGRGGLGCGHLGMNYCYQRVSGEPEAWYTPDMPGGAPVGGRYVECDLAAGPYLDIPDCSDGGRPDGG